MIVALAVVLSNTTASFAKCRLTKPDLSVAGFTLLDIESAQRVLGAAPELIGGEDDLAQARFVSQDGTQELVAYQQPSALVDEYAEVEVMPAGSEAIALKDLPVTSFKTGRGIELGMTPDAVIRILGSCFKAREKNADGEILQYVIGREHMSADLKALGFETYFAEYEFLGGKLTRFRFGFENP